MVLNNMFSKVAITMILFVSIISIGFAITPTTEPCWVKGTVTGDGVTVEDLNVLAYNGATLLKTATITDGNYSLNSVGANTGDTITLKVLGATFDTFTFASFCKTGSDPWVVRDFNVSKQANGTTCTSNSICTSGYCSTTCQTTPTTPSGGSSSSHGGTSSTTTLASTTTLLDTNTIIVPTASEIESLLGGILDGQGNNVYTPSQIADIISNAQDYELTQTVLIQKIVSSTGETTYKTTITIIIKNKTNNNLKDIKVIVEVPKAVALSATQVTSLIPFTTILADPVLEFTLPLLNAGQSTNLVYSAITTTNPDVNTLKFTDSVIRTATIIPAITPTNQCTSFTYTDWSVCTNGTQTRSVLTSNPSGCTGGNPVITQTCSEEQIVPPLPIDWRLVGGIIVILVIVGIIFLMRGKGKVKFAHK